MRFDFVTRDWSLKLFSLGAAVLLFLSISVESTTPIDVAFRIEYRVADDIIVTSDPPATLQTTLQGPWAAFRSLSLDDLAPVELDLTGAGPGALRHTVSMADIHPPAGMKVLSIAPAEIEVTLDRRVERQVPVSADIPTRPAFGFEILDVRMQPSRVRVVGPMTKMQTLDFVSTRVIDVNGRETNLDIEVNLRPPSPPLRLIDTRVHVLVEIAEEFVQRTFAAVPVVLDPAQEAMRVTPDTVTVQLRGPRRWVDNLDAAALKAAVDLENFKRDSNVVAFEAAIQLRGELPERTEVVGALPKVKVEYVGPRKRRRR